MIPILVGACFYNERVCVMPMLALWYKAFRCRKAENNVVKVPTFFVMAVVEKAERISVERIFIELTAKLAFWCSWTTAVNGNCGKFQLTAVAEFICL